LKGKNQETNSFKDSEFVNYDEIYTSILNLYGLNLYYYKPATVTRRIERRMNICDCSSLDDYSEIIKKDPAELHLLYNDMLIGVTQFFRDIETFEWLKTYIMPNFPEIIDAEGELRIWVAGCATGQEAYSLMMMIADCLNDDSRLSRVKLFASDTYAPCIQKASTGTYCAEEVKKIPSKYLEKYFIKKNDDLYQIDSSIRNKVIFSHHDITRDAPFTKLHFISCRNLLIYFNHEARVRALSTFHFSLKPGGLLFLGKSESVTPMDNEFKTVNRKFNLYKRSDGSAASSGLRFPVKGRNFFENSVKLMSRNSTLLNDPRLLRTYDVLLEKYMPTGFLINDAKEVLHSFGKTTPYLQPKSGRMTLNILSMVDYNISIALTDLFIKYEADPVPVRCSIYTTNGTEVIVCLEALNDKGIDNPFFLVTIEETEKKSENSEKPLSINIDSSTKKRITDLEQELFYTREYLQSTIEELESSNEELIASSEEIQSTNEELHSSNEELCVANRELQEKIDEIKRINSDLDNFIASTKIGTIFLDKEMNIRLFTPAAGQIFDLIQNDIGRPIKHINSRLSGIDISSEIESVFLSGKLFENEIQTENGDFYLLRIHPYTDDAGEIDGSVVVFVNIDVLRKAETALRRSEEKFRHVFENMASGAVFFEPCFNSKGEIVDFVYVDVNESYEKIFGLNKADLIGKKLMNTFKELEPQWGNLYIEVAKDGVSRMCDRFHSPTGKYLFSTCFKPEKDQTYICVTHIDLTEQKKAQSELQHAEKMNAVGQLAGGVAHDFNNQLTGIMGYSSLIVQNPQDERVVDYASKILRAAERSGDLTQKLLAFSKKAPVLNKLLDINDEIVEVVQLLKHSIDKRIKINLDLEDAPCVVSGDSGQLQNAILNLCLNARDAMSGGGNLIVKTTFINLDKKSPLLNNAGLSGGLYVKVTIKDTGKGIPANLLKHIFEPFFTTRGEEGGVGMGLAAVLGTVQSHKGTIDVKTEVGKGTEFIVYLPCECSGEIVNDLSAVSFSTLESKNILLVDDENIVRSILSEMLELHSCSVIPCSCGKDAVDVYEKKYKNIDLVILDMIMPDLNGLETFRELKKINPDIKAIILSGYSMNDDISQTLKEGALAFIQKPVSIKLLVSALKKAIG
jgi:two-component system, chemotaxis family, CheB/CheR fusion protein